MTTSVRIGAELHRGGVTFRLWAPAAKRVEVMVDRPYPMEAQAEGWYKNFDQQWKGTFATISANKRNTARYSSKR